MNSYFIETSFIINYLKGRSDTVTLMDSLDGELASSYFCLAELYEGVYRVTNRGKHEQAIKLFFSGLDTIYTVTEEIAKKFGGLRAHLKQKGEIIEDIDLFIAAICIVNNCELITYNQKHFYRVPDLKLYSANLT